MWRRSSLVVAIAFGALAGAVVAIQSPRVARNLEDRIKLAAREQLGLRVEIEGLKIELLPPAVSFGAVAAYQPDRDDPWIALHSGRVVVQPWPSPAGALVINHLTLDGLRVAHRVEGESEWDGDLAAGRLPIDIKTLELWNTHVDIQSDGVGFAADNVDLELRPDPNGGRAITLDVPSARLRLDQRTFSLEAKTRAHLAGSLDRPERLALESTKLFLRQIALRASGDVTLGPEPERADETESEPELQLTIEGGVSLAHLRALIPELPDITGDAQLEAELRGNPRALWTPPLVRFTADVADTRLAGESLGDVSVDAVYEDTQVTLEAFHVTHPTAGDITGSGSIDLTDQSLDVTARLRRASLPVILEKAGIDNPWVRLSASGDVRGTGTLSPPSIELSLDLDVGPFAVLDRGYRDADPVEILSIDHASVAGEADIGQGGVEIRGVRVQRGATELVVEGTLSFDPDQGLDLVVSGEHFDLADVGTVAGIPFAGRGTLFAALEGPYKDPVISATPALDELAVFEVPLGRTRSNVIYEDLRLSIGQAVTRRAEGSMRGEGWIDFAAEVPQIHAEVDLEDVDLADLLTGAGVERRTAGRIDAAVSGPVRLDGALGRPAGSMTLKAASATIDRIALGELGLRLDLEGSGPRLAQLQIDAAPKGASVHARIGILQAPRPDHAPPLEIDARVQGLALRSLRGLLGDAELDGTLDAECNLRGPAESLSGSVTASLPDLEAWGYALGETRLSGAATDGTLALKGNTAGTALEGALVVGRRLPFWVRATLAGLDVGRLQPLPEDVAVVTSGTVFAQGDLVRPEGISADVALTSADVRVSVFELQLAREAHLTYGDGILDVTDLGLTGEGMNAKIGGRVSSKQGLQIGIVAQGDLALPTAFVPSVRSARGRFSSRIELTGSFDSPAVDGSAAVRDATVRLKSLDQDIDALQADIEFAGRNVEIRGGSARTGGGNVLFDGSMVLPLRKEERTRLRLFSELKNVRIKPRRDVTLTASGNLSLSGPFGDLLLKGRIDVDELRYARNLELSIESFLPRRDAPLRVPDFAPGQTVAVDVHVEAPAKIYLDAGKVEAELKASLDFRGTTESLGLHGTLTPLWARARYRDLVFELVRGDIVFTEEFSLFAQFDLTAQARGCGMEMTLNLVGNSRGEYTVDLTGEDEDGPVHEQDPWSCVSFGVRLSEHAGETAMSRSLNTHRADTLDTIGSGLDLLWGVSGLDAKVRRVLPYVDEMRITLGRSGHRTNRRTAPRLVVRKEVGDRLRLEYDGALDEADDHILSLEYMLSESLQLEASWVSISDVPVGDFGIDATWRLEFD